MNQLHSERLILRRWTPQDRAPFAAMNADPIVAEFLRAPLTREESDAFIERIERHFERFGFGLWAVETVAGSTFAGFVGLSMPQFDAPFMPCVEIGWRLPPAQWGRGYATEAGRLALDFAFGPGQLDEVVSFTVPANRRSRAVMARLGLQHHPQEDFDHPGLPEGHALQRHVLYRISRPA